MWTGLFASPTVLSEESCLQPTLLVICRYEFIKESSGAASWESRSLHDGNYVIQQSKNSNHSCVDYYRSRQKVWRESMVSIESITKQLVSEPCDSATGSYLRKEIVSIYQINGKLSFPSLLQCDVQIKFSGWHGCWFEARSRRDFRILEYKFSQRLRDPRKVFPVRKWPRKLSKINCVTIPNKKWLKLAG